MSVPLSPAYALGLLTEAEPLLARRTQQLRAAQAHGQSLAPAMQAAVTRWSAHRDAMRRHKQESQAATHIVNTHNAKLTRLHQQSATLHRRSEELLQAFKQATDPIAQAQLRRSRAEVVVTLEDVQKELQALSNKVDAARNSRQAAEQAIFALQEAERGLIRELDSLQAQLPPPQLFFDVFEAQVACAHCNFVLDRQRAPWAEQLAEAIDTVITLHKYLRAGVYRLDKNSAYVAGRAVGTAEAMYACVAIAKPKRAVRLFQLATDPELFFHQIFHVFRCWCLGLYLQGQHAALLDMLQLHQFTEGVSGAYANVFLALLQRDPIQWESGMRHLVAGEWAAWQRYPMRGLGMVNVNALALCQLGRRAGLPSLDLAPHVPRELAPI